MGENAPEDATSVRVALRIRPQLAREKIDMCQVCTSVMPGGQQVLMGKDKAFTFDYVFDMDGTQELIYDDCARGLIEGCFDGYNATIFAYGQTGSGKTYSMGTGFDVGITPEEVGIIPRAVQHLFNGIDERRRQAQETGEPPPDFKVNAQFMELYNEEVLDLLDTTRDPNDRNRKSHIRIHEDAQGGIYCVGVTTKQVASLNDTMQCLHMGALCRTTASTNMNAQSSRSHAIFTLQIRQQRIMREEEPEEDKERDTTETLNEFETLTAKFHFVDLAGSERLKRTGATGERQKEGISINCGLLALGNVISALGDQAKRGSHVPYRDSKLTRLLQDSLGGNSRTVMIACVSPSDRDFMETLNTLKYANRARNIKNKVTVNQDKTSKQIAALRADLQQLQTELIEYKTGKRMIDADGVEGFNDMFHENTMLQTENSKLQQRIKAMQATVEELTKRNVELCAQREALNISNMGGDDAQNEITKLIERYVIEIEELRARLVESESMVETIKRSAATHTPSRAGMNFISPMLSTSLSVPNTSYDFPTSPDNHVSDVLDVAKRELSMEKKKLKKKERMRSSSEKENHTDEEKADNDGGEELADPDDVDMEEEEPQEEEEEDETESLSESDEELEIQDIVEDPDKLDDSDYLREDLADLTCEISIKQKLIEELEVSQKRLHTMRAQYEEKLMSLQGRIKATETERDRVLANIGNIESHSDDKAKKIRSEFEKKIGDMQADLRKVQAAKKEHAKLLRNQSHYEKQLKCLQRDLSDMKKLKVKLMNQIKEDSLRNRQSDAQRRKEITKLKKDQLKQATQIKSLEADKRTKELILRRKQEEVQALRKRQRPMSASVAGRVGKYERPPTVPVQPFTSRRKFNPKAAKAKWDGLEKTVTSIITKKQTVSHMEKDMERWLKQRESLRRKLDKFTKKREKAIAEQAEESFINDLDDQLESLRENIKYVQENINDCQSNIMQMEEENKPEDESEPVTMLEKCGSLEEAKYLLQHFISLTINKGLMAAQKDAENKELMAKLHHERMDSTFQRDMLQYLIQDKVDIDIDDSLLLHRDDDSDSDGDSSSGSASPVDSLMESRDFQPIIPASVGNNHVSSPTLPAMMISSPSGGTTQVATEFVNISSASAMARTVKARRKVTNPEDLLFTGVVGSDKKAAVAMHRQSSDTDKSVRRTPSGDTEVDKSKRRGHSAEKKSETVLMPPPKTLPGKSRPNSGSYTQLPKVEQSGPGRPDPQPSPSMARKSLPGATAKPEPSPTMRRKLTTSTSSGSLSRQSSISDTVDVTPPNSPTFTRRNRSNNVFSRLTSKSQPASPHPTRGIITATASRSIRSSPLIHSHTAMGHSKAVLSVYATEDLMFSSSKDRTAKVWDLETGEEVLTLDGHPNNVGCVRYNEETSLAYTVSTYFVKVWDIRQGNTCITTVMSSGLMMDGPLVQNTSSRQVTCPPGEMDIKDIALNSTGGVLYTAAGNTVRIWDCRNWKCVGKLSGGHQAAVMVLAVDDTDTADGNICVVTGSKDHYIKVFEVMEDSTGVLCPKFNLEPPHYDGIQSLCLMGDLLYSGSRDMCIKKWDLADQSLKHSITNAHKDWICGLAFMPGGNCLLSGCRGGFLKLWHIDNCTQLGEIKAHNSPINSITTNSQLIFTASNENVVKFWQPDWENMPHSVQEYYI